MMACASASVIQSPAEGIGQSVSRVGFFVAVPDFDGFGVPLDESPVVAAAGTAGDDSVSEPDDPESLDEPPSDEPSSLPPGDEPLLMAARRSFFAQPEPR
jgi:hypothetical protein